MVGNLACGYDYVESKPVVDTEDNLRAQGIEPIPDSDRNIVEEFNETFGQFICSK